MRDPERAGDYLFGDGPPLALAELGPQSGQIRLLRPVPSPDDPETARQMEDDRNWLRIQGQNLILARDPRALMHQEMQFDFLTCKLLCLRFGVADMRPFFSAWSGRFVSREVVETAVHLFERHSDVRLRIDLASAEFDLCGPNMRARRSDEVMVSLRPVVDALLMWGLWADRPDDRFRDLARVMVQLGRDEHRRVGRIEFTRRWNRGEQ